MEKIKAISLEEINYIKYAHLIDAACDTFVEVTTRIYNDTIPKNELEIITNVFRKLLIKKIIKK